MSESLSQTLSTIPAFDKVLDKVSDKGLNGFIQTLNTYASSRAGLS